MNNEFIRLCEDHGAIWLREVLDVSTAQTMTEPRQVGSGERLLSSTDTTSMKHSSRGRRGCGLRTRIPCPRWAASEMASSDIESRSGRGWSSPRGRKPVGCGMSADGRREYRQPTFDWRSRRRWMINKQMQLPQFWNFRLAMSDEGNARSRAVSWPNPSKHQRSSKLPS
jgi:hypothetical protein